MRIAVLSDIHGNLAALEAVLADVATQAVDLVINLGDVVSGPLWPAETLGLVQNSDWVHVRGNHDRYVGSPSAETGASDRFALAVLNDDQRDWLRDLSFECVPVPGLWCFHGTPTADDAFFLEERVAGRLVLRRAADIEVTMGDPGPSLVLCGHSHLARHLTLPGGVQLVNPGSVGLPAFEVTEPPEYLVENGSPHARYAVLEPRGTTWVPQFRHVEYDWASAAQKAAREGRPDWEAALRTGFARSRGGPQG
jgi:predicted phosphodiesterase